ncbi:MAG TPA: helix-turn-helix transcriptional regulator [Steroidobacteraceae bacterium]|jgi:transcriptional regulator with XRE-family HTH domain
MSRHSTQSLRSAFGAALRAAREARGLSQEELSLRGGFDRTYPSLLERGIRMPTLGVIRDLAVVLNVPPEQLVADALATEAATASGSVRSVKCPHAVGALEGAAHGSLADGTSKNSLADRDRSSIGPGAAGAGSQRPQAAGAAGPRGAATHRPVGERNAE